MQPDTRAGKNRLTVWIVEDHPEYRGDVRRYIDEAPDLDCEAVFASGEELLEHLNDHFAPEVILVDLGLPRMDGIEVIRRVRASSPSTQLVVLTMHEDDGHIFDAICAGALGYLLKNRAQAIDIQQAVRDVHTGAAPMSKPIARRILNLFTQRAAPQWDYKLTKCELMILDEMAEGRNKQEIAKKIVRSPHTVDTHFRNIYAKLHVRSRSAAVAKAYKERLVR